MNLLGGYTGISLSICPSVCVQNNTICLAGLLRHLMTALGFSFIVLISPSNLLWL